MLFKGSVKIYYVSNMTDQVRQHVKNCSKFKISSVFNVKITFLHNQV